MLQVESLRLLVKLCFTIFDHHDLGIGSAHAFDFRSGLDIAQMIPHLYLIMGKRRQLVFRFDISDPSVKMNIFYVAINRVNTEADTPSLILRTK